MHRASAHLAPAAVPLMVIATASERLLVIDVKEDKESQKSGLSGRPVRVATESACAVSVPKKNLESDDDSSLSTTVCILQQDPDHEGDNLSCSLSQTLSRRLGCQVVVTSSFYCRQMFRTAVYSGLLECCLKLADELGLKVL